MFFVYRFYQAHPKNVNGVSVPTRENQNKNIKVIEVIEFIAQTMVTLTHYGEKLEKQLNFWSSSKLIYIPNQLAFTCSKSTIERLEKFEICSKLKLKTPERRHFSSISIVNFELVNVSWEYSFSKAIYKLLNKKGNFIQTQMKYNEKNIWIRTLTIFIKE